MPDTKTFTVLALFHCSTTVATDRGNEGYSQIVTLDAVDGPENKAWSKATPAGILSMTVTRPEATAAFVAGRDYWLEISPAEAVYSIPVMHEEGTDDLLSVGDMVQVPGLEGDYKVDALNADGTIGLSPVSASTADSVPATAP